jgi:hypothetical protein
MSRTAAVPPPGSSADEPSAVPTLRVMRLQSPALHNPAAGSLDNQAALHNSLCLPESLGVYVGETFTAYLGVLNTSTRQSIRRLTVLAQLQTPSNRWQLPSLLEKGVDVNPANGVDAIVAHAIEEPGQHILRVEVGYRTNDGGLQTFRKFYRFQVVNPLTIQQTTIRMGDSQCFVSLSVTYNKTADATGPLVIANAAFRPVDGLVARLLDGHVSESTPDAKMSALQLLDKSGLLQPGSIVRYLFQIEATSREAVLKGIAAGDLLGQAVLTWRKAMGETGQIYSASIYCPPVQPDQEHFVTYRSGLSVDVAAAAAQRAQSTPSAVDQTLLTNRFPVTVEPIDPPRRMLPNVPTRVQFLVVNHSQQAMTLQLQMRVADMQQGLVACGTTFTNLGVVQPDGGSKVATTRLVALETGLWRVQGCVVVDLASGREIPQPPLFPVMVVGETDPSDNDNTQICRQ